MYVHTSEPFDGMLVSLYVNFCGSVRLKDTPLVFFGAGRSRNVLWSRRLYYTIPQKQLLGLFDKVLVEHCRQKKS